jgi:pilus assembly protein Flp/PilA
MRYFKALPARLPEHQPSLQRRFALLVARFREDQCGATSIEYAMIASGVAAVIAATVFSFGSTLKTAFYDKLASMMP